MVSAPLSLLLGSALGSDQNGFTVFWFALTLIAGAAVVIRGAIRALR
jgi:hypothetical protein